MWALFQFIAATQHFSDIYRDIPALRERGEEEIGNGDQCYQEYYMRTDEEEI